MQGVEDAGAMVTGGLIARELAGHSDVKHEERGGACPNCGAIRAGAFCQECGQPAHLHRDLRGFVHDVLHGVFHFEGRFWTTLPMLAFHPGQLTRRYVDGERAKFVTPMAMFLFSVFLMFAIVSNLPMWGGNNDITSGLSDGFTDARKELTKGLEKGQQKLAQLEGQRRALQRAGGSTAAVDAELKKVRDDLRGLAIASRALPNAEDASPKVRRKVAIGQDTASFDTSAWLERKLEHAKENPKLVIYKMKSAGYKYSWALIPLSLPFLWLLFFWRRDVGMYDHAVFATYSPSFMSLLVVFLSLATNLIGGFVGGLAWAAFFLIPPVHMYKQLKYGYRLGRWGAALRTFAVLMIVTITSTLFFLLLLYLGMAE